MEYVYFNIFSQSLVWWYQILVEVQAKEKFDAKTRRREDEKEKRGRSSAGVGRDPLYERRLKGGRGSSCSHLQPRTQLQFPVSVSDFFFFFHNFFLKLFLITWRKFGFLIRKMWALHLPHLHLTANFNGMINGCTKLK